MNLSLKEIAIYLHIGDDQPDGLLAGKVLALAADAPLEPRGIYLRDGDQVLLCGTIGSAFDYWQRRLSVNSAADAFIAQAIGTAAIEKTMDMLESEIRSKLNPDEYLKPRRSPGYGRISLSMNRRIIETLDATRRIGVSFTDSMILLPTKSVTAVCRIERLTVPS